MRRARPAIYFIDDGANKYPEHTRNVTITPDQAERICQLLAANTYTQVQIAEIVGCSRKVVENISCGTTWREFYYKYHLDERKKVYADRNEFNNDDIRNVCQYFQDHNAECGGTVELYTRAMKDLFNRELDHKTRVYLDLIYNRKRRKKISDDYIW